MAGRLSIVEKLHLPTPHESVASSVKGRYHRVYIVQGQEGINSLKFPDKLNITADYRQTGSCFNRKFYYGRVFRSLLFEDR